MQGRASPQARQPQEGSDPRLHLRLIPGQVPLNRALSLTLTEAASPPRGLGGAQLGAPDAQLWMLGTGPLPLPDTPTSTGFSGTHQLWEQMGNTHLGVPLSRGSEPPCCSRL